METETWKPCHGHPSYSVSSHGRIRNRYGKILKQGDNHGYKVVTIAQKTTCVHHLVLNAFIGERPAGKECNHKNGIRGDNRAENLEWVTKSENALHRCHVLGSAIGNSHASSKINSDDVVSIRKQFSDGIRICDLARKYGLGTSQIRRIVRRQKWAHIR